MCVGLGVTLEEVGDGKTRYLESREVGTSSRVLNSSGDSSVRKNSSCYPCAGVSELQAENIEDLEGWITSMTACSMDHYARSGFVLEHCVLVSAPYCLLMTGRLLDQVSVSLQCEPHMGSVPVTAHACLSGVSLSVSHIHPDA